MSEEYRNVFLLRHGERLDYVDLLWRRKVKDCAADDPPLAPKGRQQAAEAVERIDWDRGEKPIVVSSPFQRCVETAAIVAEAIGRSIVIEPGLGEVMWTFPPGYKSTTQLKSKFPLIDDSYLPIWSPSKKERFDTDCFPRVAECVDRLLDAFPDRDLLIVSHRAPIAGVFKRLIGRPYYVGLCTYSRIERERVVDGKWRVVIAGDSSHLSDRKNLRAY